MSKMLKRGSAMLCIVVLLAAMFVVPVYAAKKYPTPSTPSGSPNQTIYIHSELDRTMVLDVKGDKNKNGTKIQLWKQSKTDSAVQFVLKYSGKDGWYYIMKKGTNMCLDVTGGAAKSGVNVQLYEFNGTAAQQWQIRGSGPYHYLKNKLGYYLDAKGGSSSKGTQIQVYTYNGTDAQKWYVTPDWKM